MVGSDWWRDRARLAGVCVALLAGCGGGGGGSDAPRPPGEEIALADYFPQNLGDRWNYRVMPSGEFAATVNRGTASTGGRRAMWLNTLTYENRTSWTVVGRSDSYYSRGSAALTELPAPDATGLAAAIGAIDLYRLPLRKGESYVQLDKSLDGAADLDGDGRGDGIHLRSVVTVVGIEAVSVPAGTFTGALHLQTVLTQRLTSSLTGAVLDATTTVDEWLVPDIGLVRSRIETRGTGQPVTRTYRELESYRVGDRRSDSRAPQVRAYSPAAEDVVKTLAVSFDVNEWLDPESARAGFTVSDVSGRQVAGQLDQAFDLGLQWLPQSPLTSGRYQLRLAGTVTDRVGNPIGADLTWPITVDATEPTIAAVTPAPGATGVPLDGVITVRFSEPPNPLSITDGVTFSYASDPSATLRLSPAVAGNVLTLTHIDPLRRGIEYRVDVARVQDLSGNVLSEPLSWTFTTDPGRFARASALADNTQYSVAADLDGDGRADLLLIRELANGGGTTGLFVRRQMPDGSLGALVDTGRRSSSSCSLGKPVVADVNNDGRPDVLVPRGSCKILVLLQDAGGQFSAVPSLAAAQSLQAVDLNGDGRIDLIGQVGTGTLRSWLQSAAGTLDPQPDTSTGIAQNPSGGIAAADLDGDGRVDVVMGTTAGSDYTRQQLVILRQQPDGSFVPSAPLPAQVAQLATGDVNGDGRADVVTGSLDGVVGVLYQQADGTLAAPVSTIVGAEPNALKLSDIDVDGRLDIVVSRGSFGISYLLQRADGTLAPPQVYDTPSEPFYSLDVADLTGDGLPDLILGGKMMKQLATAASAPLLPRHLSGGPGPGVRTLEQKLRSITNQTLAR